MRRIWNALNIWFRFRRHHDELAEEMQLHMELRARKFREAGLTPEDAHYATRKQFGRAQQLQEDCRSAWGVRWFDDLRQDLSYSLRTMTRNWVFTAAAVLTLTLGIAANSAVFAFIDALILRPLPVSEPERLVSLTFHEWTENQDMPAFCYPAFESIAQRAQSVQGLFTWNETQFALGWGADAHSVPGGVASGAYYQTLGIHPEAGRFFGPADDTATAAPVAVLSYAAWQRDFGASPSAIGRKIRLDGHPFIVIGVEPKDFYGMTVGDKPAITIPIHANAALHPRWDILHSTGTWWLNVFGRLRPGATQQAANAELAALTGPVFNSINVKLDDLDIYGVKATKPRQTFAVISGEHGSRQSAERYDLPLYVLIGISLSVLAIGCLNIANLLLARAIARERELAVRLALGASRLRVVRQLITESLLLAASSALLGALLAFWITRSAAHLITAADVTPDWRVLCFIAALAIVVTMLFGVAPALRGAASGSSLVSSAALRVGRIGYAISSTRLSRLIVCTQVALSLVLISGAFLFSKSFQSLRHQDVGFDRANLVFCNLNVERSGMNTIQTAAFLDTMLQRLRTVPAVTSAALTGVVPLSGSWSWEDLSPKRYPKLTHEQRQLFTHRVSPGYFSTLHIPLLLGRDFDPGDAASKALAGVLSEKGAQLYFPGRSAVGETLEVDGKPVRIVGVVQDARYQSIRDVAPQTIYFDLFQSSGDGNGLVSGESLIVRTTASTADIANSIRQTIKESARDVSIDSPMSFDESAETALVTDRLLAILASGFASLGCLLAAIGLYGVVAYSVARRTSEIGVRMALGALRSDVVWVVFKEALGLAAIGIVVGLFLTLTGGEFVAGLLYHTQAADPFVLFSTVAVLLCVVSAAGLVPSINASRIDPMTALRWE